MVYLDAYKVLKDEKYLDVAERCADWYLSRRSEKTGLIPDGDIRDAKIDSISDFFVDLVKLYEITKNEIYLECAIQGMRGISTYHQTEISFVKSVDFQNGAVIDCINLTKYLGGYLKFLNYLYYVLSGQSALKNSMVWDLIRDR
jgi:rhamnogalacturonyl hydrolase YesR